MRTFILGMGLLASSLSLAAPTEFGAYMEKEVSALNEALSSETSQDSERLWYFRRIWFRLRPNVTFTAGVAKIGIVPELELLWERPLPDGYVPYHPN